MTKPAASYYFNKYIYCCLADNHMVFLDQKKDKYMCLDHIQTRAIWPFLNNRSSDLETQENTIVADTLNLLLDNEILTLSPKSGKDISSVLIEPASRELTGYDTDNKPKTLVKHVCYFLSSCLISAIYLRFLSLDHIVQRLEKRKRTKQKIPKEKFQDLVEIFKSLRPLIFTSHDNCMFHSLALIEYLSHFNLYPCWVFGVKMGPFVAHCWVQNDDMTLNDSVDHVAAFTPIMAV